MRGQASTRAPRRCLFCGGGKLSKEHIWSDWARDLLPKSDGYLEFANRKGRHGQGPTKILRDDQGSITNRRLKRVCQPCNNIWMGRCEEEAKAAVTLLIQGTETYLTKPIRQSLRRWVTLKLMVLDSIRDGELAFTSAERNEFYIDDSIPTTLRVWIMRCGEGAWSTIFWSQGQSVTLRIGDLRGVAPPVHGCPNVKMFLWGIGEALIVATYQREIDIEFENQEEFAIQLIPDLGVARSWPPKGINAEAAAKLTTTLDTLPASLGARLIWQDQPIDRAGSS